MASVDNWAVGKEKVGYWLSNDIDWLKGTFIACANYFLYL